MQTTVYGRGAYVCGTIKFNSTQRIFLYLGGKGEDQTSTAKATVSGVSHGGWNFGGDGGLDYSDSSYPESGAGGGGSVDIRLSYSDINNDENESIENSILSRIMVAGSGGGAMSVSTQLGYPGGNLSAESNLPYMIGGNQTNGTLGRGMNGVSSTLNQGSSGGHGSGYRGGYNILPESNETNIYQIGGTGGSSYISGYPGCISPYGNDIHESGIVFTETNMKSGSESMPDPYSGELVVGHIGSGVCKITFLDLNYRTGYSEINSNVIPLSIFSVFISSTY